MVNIVKTKKGLFGIIHQLKDGSSEWHNYDWIKCEICNKNILNRFKKWLKKYL